MSKNVIVVITYTYYALDYAKFSRRYVIHLTSDSFLLSSYYCCYLFFSGKWAELLLGEKRCWNVG